MELMLLGIYSFFVWLIFFKFKWLPWNMVSQVIVITSPIIGIAALILLLNIVAPSSADVRVINYVVAVNARVQGLVTEVPVEPNRPVRKGDVLFKLDPTPFELEVKGFKAQLEQLDAQLVTASATPAGLGEQLRNARGAKACDRVAAEAREVREDQLRELAATGAGSRFDYERRRPTWRTSRRSSIGHGQRSRRSARSSAPRASSRRPGRDRQRQGADRARRVAARRRRVAARHRPSIARPPTAPWSLCRLRPGAMAVPLPLTPAMTFVEDDQWIMAIFKQNEVRKIKPGQEAEITMKMYPGRVIKCKVDSIMWATAQGQLPIGGVNTSRRRRAGAA